MTKENLIKGMEEIVGEYTRYLKMVRDITKGSIYKITASYQYYSSLSNKSQSHLNIPLRSFKTTFQEGDANG